MAHPRLKEAVKEVEGRLGGFGRVNVRPSGTEPVVRVMVEAKEGAEEVARKLADLVSRLDRE
jgi:phosphoglucosamine mutase